MSSNPSRGGITPVRLTRAAVIVGFVVLLELAPRAGLTEAISLPPLGEVLSRLWEMLAEGELMPNLVRTAEEYLLAFVAAAVTGVPFGFLLWRSRGLLRVLNPYLTTYYAIPVFVFYPLLLAIFGFNVLPIVIIAWAWAVVAVALNAAIGFGHVPPVYAKVGRTMNLSRWEIIRRIMFRGAVPYIVTGLKLGSIYSLIGVVASEFILATEGLGFLVSFSYNNFRPTDMYAAILLILGLAIALNSSLSYLERRLYGRAA